MADPGAAPERNPTDDMPAEFYQQLENRAKTASRGNLKQGLMAGAVFLVLLLMLEKIPDVILLAGEPGLGLLILVASAAIGINGWIWFSRYFKGRN